MNSRWPMVELGSVVSDLTSSRTFEISPEQEVIDPSIRSATHTLSVAARNIGAGVRITKRVRVVPGDLVFSRLHTQKGAFAFAEQEFHATGTFIPLAIDETRIDRRFLYWALHVRVPSLTTSDSVGRETYKTADILALQIPLPPLMDQRRIVARIDELAAHVREARSLRERAVEEAKALLTSARRIVISESGAELVSLESVCTGIIDNLHSNPRLSPSGSGIPCVRSPDVGYGTLNLEGAQRTDEDEYRRRTVRGEPQADDIVLVREGGGTGKCAVVLPGQRFSLGQRVMILRPNRDRIAPRFFLHQLLSPLVHEEQIVPLCKGSASPHLNIGALKGFKLRLPPLFEQNRIVRELDALQQELNAIRGLQSETAVELEALLPSILDHTFNGGP